MLSRILFINKLIFICTYVIGCMSCCPEDTSSQALQKAYDNAQEVACVQSNVVRDNFLQPNHKAQPEAGKVYMFGNTTPARFSNTFAQYTEDGWKLVYVHECFGDDSKPAFDNISFRECNNAAKSRESSYKLTDFVEQNTKYIKFTLGADGTMDQEAFDAWCQLKQISHIPVCDRASRKQIFQNLPDCVLLNKPTDERNDCYYVRCCRVDMIGKGADDNFCAYDEANTNVLLDHQERDKSRDSARALYERCREQYKRIARNILELEEIRGKKFYYLGEPGTDVHDLNLAVWNSNPFNYAVYAIDLNHGGRVLAQKEPTEGNDKWTLIAGEGNTLVAGHIKAAQTQFEISQKQNRKSDVTEQIQNARLVKILPDMPFCELFNERFAKPIGDIQEDGMYYVWGEDFLVERINGRFYTRGFNGSGAFPALPLELIQDSKDQFIVWRENILKHVFYVVQNGEEIDEHNIRLVYEGMSPEIAASLPPSFRTNPAVRTNCIWIFPRSGCRYGNQLGSVDRILDLFRDPQQ